MYAAQKKCWNQRKLPRHSLIIISSFTAVDLDYTANLMPMEEIMIVLNSRERGETGSATKALLSAAVLHVMLCPASR